MTGDVRVDGGTRGHLWNIGRSGNFESYIWGFRRGGRDGETCSQWAIGLERSRCGCEYMGGYGIENDGRLGNGNGGGYRKIERDSGFGGGNGAGDGKRSGY